VDGPHEHQSLWAKLARQFRPKRVKQTNPGGGMRRAGQGEPDKDAAFEKMMTTTYRSGQGM
jgi:hypothetical protein